MAAPNIEFILSLKDQTSFQMDEVIEKVQKLQTELQTIRSAHFGFIIRGSTLPEDPTASLRP